MYKIAQNFPVIVKQPLFLKSTNLLKSQGSLFLCTKVKLHENSNEFETEVSKPEIRVSNKKEPASCNNRTTLSKETVSASESSKVTTLASSIKKSTTTDASSRILANTTSLNKNFAASIEPFSKTIPNVPPSEKQISIEISANNTINSSSSCKTVSPEFPPSKQQTNTLKLSPRPQDIPSQNTIKPTSSGGVQFQIPGRLLIAFTCKKCNTRNSKKISKHAYTKGVVIIRCDGCKNNHLIADNLKWFSDMGKKRNIEDIMAEKGEKVTKIVLPGGISEFLTDS